jgi:hypothetical protein
MMMHLPHLVVMSSTLPHAQTMSTARAIVKNYLEKFRHTLYYNLFFPAFSCLQLKIFTENNLPKQAKSRNMEYNFPIGRKFDNWPGGIPGCCFYES